MRGLILVCLMVFACSVDEQLEPVDTTVILSLSNPLELQPAAPVRYAVVWTLEPEPGEDVDAIADARMWVGADGPVTGGVLEVPLVVPPTEVTLAASPREIMELRRPRTAQCYRPRIVIYEDVDVTGGFSIEAFGLAGDDRVLAVDFGAAVCALFDLEGALDGAGLELTETYYVATDYRFTPFVPVSTQAGLSLRLDGEPVSLRLTDSPGPRESLTCLRQAAISDAPSVFATSRVSAHVDSALDADTLCSSLFPECTTVDLETLEPPAIESRISEEVIRVYGCRQAERTEAFIVQESRLVCEDCVCFTRAHSDVYFAEPASLPSWWPCGDRVGVCESDLPLYTLDPLCDLALVEEDEEP